MNTQPLRLTTVLLTALLLAAPTMALALDVDVRQQAGMWGLSMDGIEGTPVFSVPLGTPGGAPIPTQQITPDPHAFSNAFDSLSVAGNFGVGQDTLGRSFADNVAQPLLLGPVQTGIDWARSGTLGLETTAMLYYGALTPSQALSSYGQAAWNVVPGSSFVNFGVDATKAAVSTAATLPQTVAESDFGRSAPVTVSSFANMFDGAYGW